MTESMIARVAEALWDKDRAKYGMPTVRFCELIDFRKVEQIELARAAIEAMREPDEAMKAAIHQSKPEFFLCVGDEYRAMIDAALSQPPAEKG